MPRRKIIAVFGTSDGEGAEIAKDLGSAIAEQQHIVLTGGSGEQDERDKKKRVTELALQGALEAGGYAIGVKRDNTNIGFTSVRETPNLGIVKPMLGHTRNALEACLCDAAVALDAGKSHGTTSEAVLCLSLGKPVVFVYQSWKKNYELSNQGGIVKSKEMRDDALKRVTAKDLAKHDVLRDLFDPDRVLNSVRTEPKFLFQEQPDVEKGLNWLQRQVQSTHPGFFPWIAGYEEVIAGYYVWLKQIPPKDD